MYEQGTGINNLTFTHASILIYNTVLVSLYLEDANIWSEVVDVQQVGPPIISALIHNNVYC